jgi:zinc/manganese transport system substrate-binding protein
MRTFLASGLCWLALLVVCSSRAEPITVVAAENVYGDIARQVGGPDVTVISILSNPNQDPHEFEASASTARAIADARLVIYNGAGYDPWAVKLLSASKSASREVVEVAKLARKKAGENPHLWYEVATISALGSTLVTKMTQLDAEHRSGYAERGGAFEASIASLRDRIATLRSKHAGTLVTATEPVFDYMAAALGLKMRNSRFQLAVMNGTEPSATEIAAFEEDLRTRAVKVLLYNSQTTQALAERMRTIATEIGVPVVAVTETEPPGQSYQQWMLSQLNALDRALGDR